MIEKPYFQIAPQSVAAEVFLVVPLVKMCERYFHLRPLIVGPGIKTGIRLRYENPREIGADRIVNSVGAFEQYGGPLIVVDIGTATTFDIVDGNGDYLGGVIAPGVLSSMNALFSRTALLPQVELVDPKMAIGRNTIKAMQVGIVYGEVDRVDGLVHRIEDQLGYKAKVVATGGLASTMAKLTTTVTEINPELTLQGIRLIYENQPK